ncbi:benzoate/H(+) symporter BenE family transporter [Microterricola viridarii]|uniref:benzoate/H(+) symporter BenE family transporter n=1 Tax=Microterricola viridarii TaxID=412690 RepID=UPI0038B2951A
MAGLVAVGASDEQAASGLFALCLAVGVICVLLPWLLKVPVSFAWSTPGAALLLAAGATTQNFAAAVGAFLVCAALIVLCGLWPLLGRLITRIPKSLAGAMLAGILFPICIAPVTAAIEQPLVAVPMILVWLLLSRLAPRWAVPAAMLVAAVGIAAIAGPAALSGQSALPRLEFVAPVFEPAVIVSLGIPLFIVTMAGQNVPGFAVLSTFGYTVAPRTALLSTGLASAGAALFGGHVINLAAITAALMASPEAHPERSRRWVATVSSGFVYLALGVGAGVAAALVAAAPPVIIIAVAGLALLGALVTAVSNALEVAEQRISAIATFLVTASGVAIAGIGSAFWGLLVGGVFLLWLVPAVRTPQAQREPALRP